MSEENLENQETNEEQELNKINNEVKENLISNVQKVLDKNDEERENVDELEGETGKDKSDKDKSSDDGTKKSDADEHKEDESDKENDEVEDKSNSEKKDKSDTTTETAKKISELSLPNRLLQAAKRNRISDGKILSYGENAKDVLEAYANASDIVSTRLGEIGRKAKLELAKPKKTEDSKSTPKIEIDEDDSEEVKALKQGFKALQDAFAEFKKSSAKKDESQSTRESKELDGKIDTYFDSVAEDYPEFGNAKKLTAVEQILRQKVWEDADNIMIGSEVNGSPIDINEALSRAVSIYEGKNPRKVREKIVKETKKREQQLITRPKSKKTATAVGKGRDAAVKAVSKHIKERSNEGW